MGWDHSGTMGDTDSLLIFKYCRAEEGGGGSRDSVDFKSLEVKI